MSDTKSQEGCAALAVAWLISWPSGAIRALVAMKGWEWFVTDTFGAPSLGLIEAWGLFLLISFATLQYHHDADDRTLPVMVAEGFFMSLVMSTIAFTSLLTLVTLR